MTSRRQDGASSSYPPPPLTEIRAYVGANAKEILRTRDITGITKLVTKLCYGKETEPSSPSKDLYDAFRNRFPNILAGKLLQFYRFSTDISPKIRSYSLGLIDSLLIDLDICGLTSWSLKDIKTHLNSCLLEQETSDEDFRLLSRIVSRVSVDVFIRGNPWEELCSYILSLDADKKALLMFSELPTLLDEEFLMPLLENGLDSKIVKGLLNQNCDEEEWCLALETGFSLMLQLVIVERKSLVWDLVYVIVKSVWEMVNVKRREIVVRKGFVKLARKVRREAGRFRDPEYEVVSRFGLMLQRITGLDEVTKTMAKMINEVLERNFIGGKGDDNGAWNSFKKSKTCSVNMVNQFV